MTIVSILLAVSFLDFFEARNTAANFVHTPPKNGEAVEIVRPSCETRAKCPACKGERQLVLEEPNFGQANGRLGGAKKRKSDCPVCGGNGFLKSFVNPAELKLSVAQDRERFAADHLRRGEIAIGEAFVPKDAYDRMSREERKLVEDAFPAPCPKCCWTGLEPCRKCSGNGTLACPEKDCKGGFLVTKTTTERTHTSSGGGSFGSHRGSIGSRGRRTVHKETKVTVTVCPTCSGANMIRCPDCLGRRAHPCAKCNGTGIKRKGGAR